MATSEDLDLSPPDGLNRPLWKSLIRHFRDRFLDDGLPPLYLTSRPVNLGMLLGDFLDLPWYRTVFTNLGDVISPETQPPLELTSEPANAIVPSDALLLAAWSNVISTPKVFLPDKAKPVLTAASPGLVMQEHAPQLDPAALAFVHDLEVDLRKDLRRSRRRERFLMFAFAAEVVVLIVGYL